MPDLTLPWGRMAYGDSGGDGFPIVFLHGTGCDAADWAPTLRALSAPARCVTPEFRGHGGSATPAAPFTLDDLADDVVALLDALHLRHVLLVGHSLGGMVAMAAAHRSARPVGLVLLEGWTRLAVVLRAFPASRFYGQLSAEARARVQAKRAATQARFEASQWTQFWRSVEAFDGRECLRGARIPIVEAYGGEGRTPETQALLEVPDTPWIEWEWIADAAHYLPLERPDETARVCRRGWERCRAQV